MQEKMSPVFLRYESYPSKTSFSNSNNNLVLRMRRLSFVLQSVLCFRGKNKTT